ncbi:MAG: permease-like cell division protein FtsX [Pseudohongiellaceae bacterium]
MRNPENRSRRREQAIKVKDPKKRPRGARTQETGPSPARAVTGRLSRGASGFMDAHRNAATESFQRLLDNAAATLSTASVIGIALLLPALLVIAGNNLSQLAGQFRTDATITLYLNLDVTEDRALQLSEDLLTRNSIDSVNYVSRDQARADFATWSGLGDILATLEENPLPGALVVVPAGTGADAIQALHEELRELEEVEHSEADLQWLQRLQSLTALVERTGLVLSLLLGAGVILVIGNTIQLAIDGRSAEIVVSKLVGATDSYVARPFLYTGLFYGLAGGILAALLQLLVVFALAGPLQDLVLQYGGNYRLQGGGLPTALILLCFGGLLGWTGAMLAAQRQLPAINP